MSLVKNFEVDEDDRKIVWWTVSFSKFDFDPGEWLVVESAIRKKTNLAKAPDPRCVVVCQMIDFKTKKEATEFLKSCKQMLKEHREAQSK